jgi:hypothetical protein
MTKNLDLKPTRQLLLVLLTLLWTSVLASALPGRAEVKKITGHAYRINPAGVSTSLAEGMVLGAGDTVATGPGSIVDLWLGLNGDALRVDPDTTLRFDVLDIASIAERRVTTSLNLTTGSITGNVRSKLSAASKYEIKTAAGVAEIRGTIYAFKSNGTLVVTQGVVNFTYVDKGVTRTVRVEAGQQFRPGKDDAPTQASEQLMSEVAQVAAQILPAIGTIREGNLTVTVTTIENPLNVSASGN